MPRWQHPPGEETAASCGLLTRCCGEGRAGSSNQQLGKGRDRARREQHHKPDTFWGKNPVTQSPNPVFLPSPGSRHPGLPSALAGGPHFSQSEGKP